MRTLKLGDRGPEVGQIHQLLLESAESVDVGELRDSFFGPSTRGAVIDFQAHHVDEKGHVLAQDGVVGGLTMQALREPHGPLDQFIADGWRGEPSSASAIARPAVVAAINEIGVLEEPFGSNLGPRVEIYQGPEYRGLHWCMLFCSWAWSHADGGSPFGKIASVRKLRDWAAQHGRLIVANDRIQPGDIFLILRGDRHGHCGLATAPEITGQACAFVEGNTANSVRATVRDRAQFVGVVRPA